MTPTEFNHYRTRSEAGTGSPADFRQVVEALERLRNAASQVYFVSASFQGDFDEATAARKTLWRELTEPTETP